MPVTLRLAGPEDAARLDAALRKLSLDLDDTHAANDAVLAAAGWGTSPVFRAHLAEMTGETVGVILYSPCFSTTRGGAGIYVSDLWATPHVRGQGLGRRLLAAALADGAATWGAGFIKLSAYHDSTDAMRFYTRLGFRVLDGQHDLILDKSGCTALSTQCPLPRGMQ